MLAENIHTARTVAKEKLAWNSTSKKILLEQFLTSNINVNYQAKQGREKIEMF